MRLSLRLLVAAMALVSGGAHAACSTPAGKAGDTIFSTTAKSMQYCNGTSWVNAGVSVPAAGSGGCSTPTAKAGDVIYNGALGVVQFCNGENWVNTACADTRSPGGSGCTGPTGKAGNIIYETTSNELQFCDSTNWVAMGWPCMPQGPFDWANATQIQKITADGDFVGDDSFGVSVAISGNLAVAGARLDDDRGTNSGSAYVFNRGSSWTQTVELFGTTVGSSDSYGYNVATDGNTIIVSSRADDDTFSEAGAAFIFYNNNGTWTQQAKVQSADVASGDQFGHSVDVSGDYATVSTPVDDDAGTSSGTAFVFFRNSGVWAQQAKLVASDAAASDEFGISSAISGNYVVVGSHLDDDKGSSSGSAYIYLRTGTSWAQQAKVTASDGAANDRFGFNVDIDADTIVVGAPLDDDKGTDSGSVYVYTRSGTTWTQQAKLTASDGAASDNFGWSVAINGNAIIVGAPLDDDAGASSGSAYVFVRDPDTGTWTQKKKLVAADAEAGDQFGWSVAISGNVAMVGANLEDTNASNAGAAYFFGR